MTTEPTDLESPSPDTPAPQGGGAAGDAEGLGRATEAHRRALIGGDPVLTMAGLAEQAGTAPERAERFWRAMGFPDAGADEVLFTSTDVEALRGAARLVDERRLSTSTLVELLRAQSFTMDRLVLWQLEALVSDAARREGLTDTEARRSVLESVDEVVEPLLEQLTYTWRRHLAALVERSASEVSRRDGDDVGPSYYPLTRALGFVDIVSFTTRSQGMAVDDLTTMLNDFEHTARDVITSRGARVVKTIGDAVMYVADDLPTGADVVTALVDELQSGPEMLRVRASLVHGRVVSRSGDVFGPTVNLASRLVDTAEPGGIRMDEPTALALLRSPVADRYQVRACHDVVVRSLGQLTPWELVRA